MPYFSDETIKDLHTECDEVRAKYADLMPKFTFRKYTNEQAREYATHGFSRRLRTAVRCIENIFSALPPEREDIPNADDILDAQINIQTFVTNIFGGLDNLAWIWVYERGITLPNGSSIPRLHVGLFKGHSVVRHSFSGVFQKTLESYQPWYKNLEDFRHALGHRIPLYIPPYTLDEKGAAKYQELEKQAIEAANHGKFEAYHAIQAKQQELGRFSPIMVHSFSENSPRIVFHGQVLADFNTLHALALEMIKELNSQ